MTNSADSYVSPYHPGCKHRYSEHMDHNALIAKLNDIADEQYKLLLLCNELETRLTTHDDSSTAHPYIRTLVDNINTRLGSIKIQIDTDIENLRNAHTADITTLTAADSAINTHIDHLEQEITDIQEEIDRGFSNLDHPINSSVNSGNLNDANSGKVIINSTAPAGYNMAFAGKSTHGKFTTGINNTNLVANYTVNGNTTGNPTYSATLLDENGNATFPNTVTATNFSGKASAATVADSAAKLTNPVSISIQDVTGDHIGAPSIVDGSRSIVLKLPDTLSNTNITGIANRAYNDDSGANIQDTYVHKTNLNETIAGTKSFTNDIKVNTVSPIAHANSSVGTNAIPYENVYSTNFTGVNATINNITGNLTGNASTSTKLQSARKINGTDFDGTTAITTTTWGTARNISIADATDTNTGAAIAADGSANITLKLPASIKADVTGNASSATKLAIARKINGADFDGTAAITTDIWGAYRDISISDATNTNISTATSVNGSTNVTLKLPASIKAHLDGTASSAAKLENARSINGTGFDGTANIVTNSWGATRDISISDATANNTGTPSEVNGSSNITLKLPANIKANLDGNATTATTLQTARKINGTNFNGSIDITTATWGTSRNITISDSSNSNVGTAVSVNGGGNVTLKLPATIRATLDGNAATANTLKTARTINGTNFDGSTDIITSKWGTSRNITIADASNTYTGVATSTDGSANIVLKLPDNITATNFYGVATSAGMFATNQTIKLTGDVTGEASSKGGWTISTALKNSGVTANSYGNSTNQTPGQGGTFKVPYITVNAKGIITAISDKTVTIPVSATTDTKVTQTVTTGNTYYPVLLGATGGATETETNTSRFSKGLSGNARYGNIRIQNTYNSDNLKGSTAGAVRTSGAIYAATYDNAQVGGAELGAVTKTGVRYSRLFATNHITNNQLSTTGTETTAYLDVAVGYDGSAYLSTTASIAFSPVPKASGTYSLGSSTALWKNVYATTVHGNLVGNADTATQFSTNKSVTLTGDVTGTASSKAGWSISTTLANSGVTAGSYGNSTNQTPAQGGTFNVPYITVDAKGRVTAISNKTVKIPVGENTDTLVSQSVSTSNSEYPVLLCPTAGATTSQGAKTSIFAKGVSINPYANTLTATNVIASNLRYNSLSQYKASYTKGNTISSSVYLGNSYKDSEGNTLADVLYFLNPSSSGGNAAIGFRVWGNPHYTGSSSTSYVTIGCGVKPNNTYFTFAPTPPANSNDQNIATTEWVKARIAESNPITKGAEQTYWYSVAEGNEAYTTGDLVSGANLRTSKSGTTTLSGTYIATSDATEDGTTQSSPRGSGTTYTWYIFKQKFRKFTV